MDEDAPALAGVAAQAVHVLNDATCASVQTPGLGGLADTEAVVASLTRLAEELQDTAAHLDGFLIEQLTRTGSPVTTGPTRRPAQPCSAPGMPLSRCA